MLRSMLPPKSLSVLSLATMSVLYFITPTVEGQRITARIVGITSDSTGAVVADADVTAVNQGTAIAVKTKTDEQGYYVLEALPIGNYDVTVGHPGFKNLRRTGIVLAVNQVVRIDLQLELGDLSQTVTVHSEASQLNSENASGGSRVLKQQIDETPLPFTAGRNTYNYVQIGVGIASVNGPYETENYTVNGAPQRTQVTGIDGSRINLPGVNSWAAFRPSPEEVEEIKVDSGSYSAENGGFGVISMVTHSGTNALHGTGFYFFSDAALRARNFFDVTKPPFSIKEYGGTFTGPVIRNRTFFALNYERWNRSIPASNIVTMPTQALRSGNFQGVANIFDPNTTRLNANGVGYVRDPFPSNQIPQSRMDPVALKLLAYLPLPNIPGNTSLVNNYNGRLDPNSNNQVTLPAWSIKINQKITDRDQAFGRFQSRVTITDAEQVFAGYADTIGSHSDAYFRLVTFGETHTFTPTLVNEFRMTYKWNRSLARAKARDQNIAQQVGLKNVSAQNFPIMSIGGAVPVTFGAAGDSNTLNEGLEFDDSLTKVWGRQTIKIGGGVWRERNSPYSAGIPSGNFGFSGIFTNQPQVSGAAAGFADFLLGLASSATVTGGTRFDYRKYSLYGFVQDDIKLTRNLTMNLGARYEYGSGVRESNNFMSQFSNRAINPVTRTPGAIVFAGVDAPTSFGGGSRTNLAPRFGMAYRLKEKTVLRAGFSLNYFQNPINYQTGLTLGFIPSLTLTTTNQITPSVVLSQGPPSVPPPAVLGSIGNNQSVKWIPDTIPSMAYYQWSLGVQRELPGKLFAEITYVGGRGLHLWFPRDINQVPQSLLGPGNNQSLRPYPTFQGVTLQSNDGKSWYQAVQVTVRRRLAAGLTFASYYTFSKALDNSSYDFAGGSAPYQNLANLRAEWAVSDHDVPHLFTSTLSYQIPQWLPKQRAKLLTKGWQVSAVGHLRAGLPLNLATSSNQSSALSGFLRPNCLADGQLSNGTPTLWFNPGAYALPAPYSFGNCGRNVLRSPGFAQLDFSIAKNTFFRTPLNESTNLQLRIEFYNGLNHANFRPPNGSIGSLAAGRISSAYDPRLISFGLRFVF